jgi:hypothetical protein
MLSDNEIFVRTEVGSPIVGNGPTSRKRPRLDMDLSQNEQKSDARGDIDFLLGLDRFASCSRSFDG